MSEFDKYIVQGEPSKKAKASAWQTAIGLQDVDGLKPSEYLIKAAVQHIEGDITIDQPDTNLQICFTAISALSTE